MSVGNSGAAGMSYSGNKPKKKKKPSSGGGGLLSSLATDNTAGSLAEIIERQAASQKAQAEAKNPGAFGGGTAIDPFQALQSQLFDQVNSIQSQTTPLDQIQKMAASQVGSQFDPQIEALVRQISQTEDRGKKNEGQAREMYNSLGSDFMSQLPQLTQQYAAEDQATNKRYDDAQGVLDQQYNKQAADQDAVLRRLGIQAAAPEASQQASDDQKYFQGQMELDQQQQRNSMDQEQMASQDYQRSLGNNARMTGENTAQDIAQQVSDFVQQAQGQLGTLQSQRSSALDALVGQMQAQDQQHAESQRQQEIDNMMKMFNFQLDATKAGMQNGGGIGSNNAPSLFKGTTGLEGASNYLGQQYPDQPILAKNLMEELNHVLQNPDVVKGKFMLDKGDPSLGKGPTYSDVGQEYMMDLLRKEFENQGSRYSNQDINSTMNALLAYLGKLR